MLRLWIVKTLIGLALRAEKTSLSFWRYSYRLLSAKELVVSLSRTTPPSTPISPSPIALLHTFSPAVRCTFPDVSTTHLTRQLASQVTRAKPVRANVTSWSSRSTNV